jgi:hypothetical protein
MGSTAGTGFEAKRARDYSDLVFLCDQEPPVPARSPFVPSEAQLQHYKHAKPAAPLLKHKFFAWQPVDSVRRPYDPSMRLCTAHISQYSEVPDDSSSFTEAVGQEASKNMHQIIVQLAKRARPKHSVSHARIGGLQNTIYVPPLPQLLPSSRT